VTPEDARAIREELTALRLASEANTNTINARFEKLETLMIRYHNRPGWRLYGLMLAAMLLGWFLPR
jgi:iron uptake system EfeUOB component EfeO/EfeM